jgi:transglutaminase-like putative cysteine protease
MARITEVSERISGVIAIDNQPIAASFFGEGQWLTDLITPNALDIQSLYQQLTQGISNSQERIIACWNWVTSQVKYVKFVKGYLWVNGRSSVQKDYWQPPSLSIETRVGNCATKSFLLCSLLRNELPPDQVYCTLGNLHNGKVGGHAWVTLKLADEEYVMESTTPTAPPLVPSSMARRYEPVHYFNDQVIQVVEGKSQILPYTLCYSTWLSDYLNWAYIEKQRGY